MTMGVWSTLKLQCLQIHVKHCNFSIYKDFRSHTMEPPTPHHMYRDVLHCCPTFSTAILASKGWSVVTQGYSIFQCSKMFVLHFNSRRPKIIYSQQITWKRQYEHNEVFLRNNWRLLDVSALENFVS